MSDTLFVAFITLYTFVCVWTFLFFGKDTDGVWMIPIRFAMGVFWPVVWLTELFMGFGLAIRKAVRDANNKDKKSTSI